MVRVYKLHLDLLTYTFSTWREIVYRLMATLLRDVDSTTLFYLNI